MKQISFWGRVKAALASIFTKEQILAYLERQAVKGILKKLAIAGGFKAWLIAFVVGELIEEADEHLIEPALRKLGYKLDSLKGQKIYVRIENAQDIDEWSDVVDDA